MAGLFFCLAPAEGAGLLFLPGYNTATYKRLQRVLRRQCSYTTNAAKHRTGLYRCFSGYLPHFAAIIIYMCIRLYRTACDTPDTAQLNAAAYYNNVYKGASLLWIHASRCSISQIMPARRGQLLPCVNRWQVLTHCQQYRPGAPAEGAASPPVQGQPGGLQSGTGQRSGRTRRAVQRQR